MTEATPGTKEYERLALFINDRWIGADLREGEAVRNPATGQVLATLPHATEQDLEAALAAAGHGFGTWRSTPAFERASILRKTAELIRARIEAIATTLTLEQGKPLAEARGEVAFAADCIEWYAEEGRRAYGRIVPARSGGVRQMVLGEPIGPAVAFTPWNFPALTPARKIGGALAAGCSLILKAAEETPGTAVAIVRAFADAGLPDGVLNLVFGDPARVSTQLIASPITRKLSFTGSTPVGRHLMHLAIDGGMMRTTMELGGHAPVIVFDDVDVEAVATIAAGGKYRNAGQVCIAPTRFYVQEKIFDRFVAKFAAEAEARVLGDGMAPTSTMGPLANSRRMEAMERIMVDARSRGAEIVTGGERRGNQGHFFAPTVITGLGDDALIMTDEPFGPIAPIVPFKDFGEVVRRANSLPFGLAAYAFAASEKRASNIGDALEAGMVGVNTLAVSTPETPFGGVKDSGHGSESGIEGLQAYLDTKLLALA